MSCRDCEKNRCNTPAKLLKDYIVTYLKENQLAMTLESEIPQKWEKYGDFILLDKKTFHNDVWKQQDTSFWIKICEILKCRRIGIKGKIADDDFRSPTAKLLIGEDPWITYTDNSIKYTWNFEKTMFSAGNAPERHRIAKLDCKGEIIVDLFAGIGYFTLPFLVHAKAELVHACEWNPSAIIALKKNLKLNKVENKCIIYEGDNRVTCPKRVADRVNLGLIPSSEQSWKVACEALKSNGGVLHIHGNVETKKDEITCDSCTRLIGNDVLFSKNIIMNRKDQKVFNGDLNIIWKRKQWLYWGVHVLHSIMSILMGMDRVKELSCCVENLHFVKSYAPHVDHLVLDLRINYMEESSGT